MLNYVRHDEEFYCIIKLSTGIDILTKALVSFDDDLQDSVVFITDPVEVAVFTKEVSEEKAVKGMGFTRWMQFSDEDFFILRQKDILTMAELSPEMRMMYQLYINGQDPKDLDNDEARVDPDKEMGSLGKVEDARRLFEKLFKK